MMLRKGRATQYAPVPAVEFLDHLHRGHEELISSLKDDLAALTSASDLEYVWNIEGHENIMGKAMEMIGQARATCRQR